MKQSLIFSFALLFLMACGQEEAAQPASEAPAVVQEQIADDVSDATENSEEVSEEAIEVVEESAAEPDDDEQAIVLAQAEAPAAAREWRYQEGKNYIRLVPTQPTVGGADKIEVAEFFWYGCPHCYNFEPAVNKWAADVPANVRFVRIPAMWNGALVVHARLYYTEEILVRNGVIKNAAEFRDAVFQEYHLRNNRLMTEGAIQNVFERFGVSADEFERTWNSFEVDQKMRVGDDLARRYSVASVPTMVVNGKFRSGAQEAGGYPQLLEVMDELIARESMR